MKNHYLAPTTLYEEARKRQKELAQVCKMLEKRIAKHPEGKIHIIKCNGTQQYYLRTEDRDKSGTYIPRCERDKIHQYLKKRYDCKTYTLLKAEKENLDKFLKRSKFDSTKIQAIYSDFSKEIKEELMPVDVTNEDYASEWQAETYERKKLAEDVPTFITEKGDRVRSKSELNIANALYKRNIPYKYECALSVEGGRIIYPDFKVLNQKQRKEFIWEHRGMMDNAEYANHSVQRIKQLEKNGYFLGESLIITEETSACPLGTDDIEMIIKHYFDD